MTSCRILTKSGGEFGFVCRAELSGRFHFVLPENEVRPSSRNSMFCFKNGTMDEIQKVSDSKWFLFVIVVGNYCILRFVKIVFPMKVHLNPVITTSGCRTNRL